MATGWALFQEERQLTLPRPRKMDVIADALNHGALIGGSPDFPGQRNTAETVYLADGYEIREVEDHREVQTIPSPWTHKK